MAEFVSVRFQELHLLEEEERSIYSNTSAAGYSTPRLWRSFECAMGVTAFVSLSIALFTPLLCVHAAQRYNRRTGAISPDVQQIMHGSGDTHSRLERNRKEMDVGRTDWAASGRML